MHFRLKSKHWVAKGIAEGNHDPTRPVRPGSQQWRLRAAANDLYNAGRMPEYETAKRELIALLSSKAERKAKNGPKILSLELRHGDMVVMHGERIQELYEVKRSSFLGRPFFTHMYTKLTGLVLALCRADGKAALWTHGPVYQAGEYSRGGALEG